MTSEYTDKSWASWLLPSKISSLCAYRSNISVVVFNNVLIKGSSDQLWIHS